MTLGGHKTGHTAELCFWIWAVSSWCERGDSNPHGFTRQILSLVRLPIPPLSHGLGSILLPLSATGKTLPILLVCQPRDLNLVRLQQVASGVIESGDRDLISHFRLQQALLCLSEFRLGLECQEQGTLS